jgi:FAD synthetase
MRLELVSALKPVDKAFLGHEGGDIFKVVQELKPDIITIGYDQPFEERTLEGELEKRGLRVQVVRMPHLDHDLDGTRKIIRKVIEFHEMSKKLSEVEKK